MNRYAFFDFDGTLIHGDSIIPFLFYATRNRYCGLPTLLKAGWLALLWKLKLLKEGPAKTAGLQFLKKLPKKQVEALCRGFCRDVLAPSLYEDGKKELEHLKKEGYRIVVVSASPDIYMEEMQQYLHYDCLLATRFNPESGSIEGQNCKGSEKVERIRKMLRSANEKTDFSTARAYGDSLSDAYMLKICGQRYCVNASSSLRELFKGDRNAHFPVWK